MSLPGVSMRHSSPLKPFKSVPCRVLELMFTPNQPGTLYKPKRRPDSVEISQAISPASIRMANTNNSKMARSHLRPRFFGALGGVSAGKPVSGVRAGVLAVIRNGFLS